MLTEKQKIVGPTPLRIVTDDQSYPTTHVLFFTRAIFLSSLTHLQFKTDLDWIYDIYGSAGSADSIGDMSSIVRLPYQEYKSMDPKKIGSYFSRSSILVTGVPVTTPSHPSFPAALKSLGRMNKDIVIEG